VLFILLLVWGNSVSAAPVLTLHKQQNTVNLAPYLELLEDPQSTFSIDEIMAMPAEQFKTNTATVPSLGRTRSTWWVKFQLKTDHTQDWFLLLDYPLGGDMQVFQQTAPHPIQLSPVVNRATPVYQVKPALHEPLTVYIRVTNHQGLLALPLKLVTTEPLLTNTYLQTLIFGMLFAGIMVLGFYNLLLFISLRELSYLSLTVFTFSMSGVFLQESHLFPALFWVYRTDSYFSTTPFLLTVGSAFHYWRYINAGYSRTLEILCHWIPILFLGVIPLAGLVFFAEQLLLTITLILAPIVLFLITQAALNGHHSTRNNYWAALIFATGIIPYLLVKTGWLMYDRLYVYGAQIAVLIALLLLSFAHAQQTHRMREAKERSEVTNKTKDEFLSTMSHELRTPMNAVVGINALLQMTPLNPEQQDYVRKLDASSTHLLRLIDEVLDLSRMQQSAIELRPAPFQLNTLLDELRHMFSVLAEHKGLALHVLPASEDATTLLGDAARLAQVLGNLLGNAIKYTPTGVVTLTTRLENHDTNSLTLCFIITDTGTGIAPEHLPYLFEPFYQVSRQQQHAGSGLGLAISHKLVTRMGGNLHVTSQLGQGSHFYLTLTFPLATTTETPQLGTQETPLTLLQHAHLLLVDDDAISLFVGKRLLETHGIQVVTAANGAEALAQCQQQKFDVILMDVSLPDQSGYEVVRAIRTHTAFHTTPIIALTAHTIPDIHERCLEAGMDDFLGKPFRLEDLLAKIAYWLAMPAASASESCPSPAATQHK
jgi:signal transduction histidine kinase/CheY-like chemotaxis protein